jgi:hypothetical protein
MVTGQLPQSSSLAQGSCGKEHGEEQSRAIADNSTEAAATTNTSSAILSVATFEVGQFPLQ